MSNKIAVKIEQTHECGQVIEQIFHVDNAEFSVTSDYLPMPKDAQEGPFHVPESPKSTITFEGEYTGMEITGLALRDNRMVCVRCGADVLFPDQEKATMELSREQVPEQEESPFFGREAE